MKDKKKKYKGMTGYRLHNRRLKFSNKKSIRTIKFPLVPTEESRENYQRFIEDIKHDYENEYGPLNITTYERDREKENHEKLYSLKDFWIDSLRAGVVLMHSHEKLKDMIRTYDGSKEESDNRQKKLLKETNQEFYSNTDYEKVKKQIILLDVIKRDRKSFDIFITDCNEEYKNKTEKELLNSLSGKSREEQNKYLKDKYGIDKTIFSVEGLEEKERPNFYIFPDLPLIEDSVEKCVERTQDFIKEKLENSKEVKELLGISDNAGGFSNYFNIDKVLGMLKDDDFEKIEEIIFKLSPNVWKGKEDELRKRLIFLSEKAKLLKKSKLVKGWHYYRTDLAGSITSWLSNSFEQDEKIKKQLFGFEKENGHYQELGDVEEKLNEFGSNEEIKELKELSDFMKEILEKIKETSKIKNIPLKKDDESEKINLEYLEDYRKLLSDFRTKLNYAWQQEYGDNQEDEEGTRTKTKQKTSKKTFPALHKELRRIPQFLGENKIKEEGLYDKYFKSYERVKEGINFLIELENKRAGFDELKNEEEREKKIERIKEALQSFLRAHRNCQSETGKRILSKLLNSFVIGLEEAGEWDYIYRNPKSRERRGKELKLNVADGELLNRAGDILDDTKIIWEKYKDSVKINEWLDFIAIEKVRIGLLSSFYDMKVDFKEMRNHFPNIEIIKSRFRHKGLNNESYNTIIQNAILSEMKGTISKMSTEKLIARYVVQPIESEKKYPLVFNFNPKEIKSKKEFRKKGQNYYIYDKKSEDENSEVSGFYQLETKNINLPQQVKEVKKLFKSQIFGLRSSKYQLQFLDNSLFGCWEEFKPTLSSYSFIVEEYYKIEWVEDENDNSNFIPKFTIDEKKGDKGKKLFVSIPFNINGEKEEEEYQKRLAERKRFLGIDIGEYGIATYLLDTDNFSDKEPYTSFIHEPTLRKIKEGVREIKENQKAGTFSVPNTKLKRVRDNAITTLRNRIHDLVLKHNARPVYEKEVSAFESGSGKVSKVYDSVKRSDVYAETSAAELEHKLIWGDGKLMIGKDVGAYATSYMCSHCKKSIYAYISRENYGDKKNNGKNESEVKTEYEVLESDGKNGFVTYDVEGEKVKGYVEKDREKIKKGCKLKGREVIEHVRKYARPPVKILNKHHGHNFKEREEGSGTEKRGNQAVFICPFCGEHSDADKQAAMWIALKGYLNMFLPKEKPSKIRRIEGEKFKDDEITKGWDVENLKDKIKYLLDFAKDKGISPVGLNPEKDP